MSTMAPIATAWSPLKVHSFRWLWIATLVSNIGTWMHEVGAGWLMTNLTTSPIIVALLQTATSLPAFFLLLPSGALSDIIDRRRYLMAGNIGMCLTAVVIAGLTLGGLINATSLLILTLLMGIGAAMIMPAWQSIVPELVPRSELQGAIGLNTLGMNVARAIGPLIAGLLIARLGTGAVFICNALSFILIITVLLRWKRVAPEALLPPERFGSAIATGLGYARHSPALQATIIRSIGFYFFASVMWSLLPLIARVLLEGDEQTYSWLFASVSLGAIGNALLLPRWRRYLDNDQLITLSALVFAVGMSATALVPNQWLAMAGLTLCGAAWITVMTCAQMSAQTALPNWIRSRGIAVFLTFFMGSLGIGPVVWGSIAEFTNLPTAMLLASGGLVIASLFTRRWPLSSNDNLDHNPSRHWRKPEPVLDIKAQQGPVMINVRYDIAPEQRAEFLASIHELGKVRKRDGARFWQYFEDAVRPGSFVEVYVVDTWLDHLRQHERISRHDARVQERIKSLLVPGTSAVVSHFAHPMPSHEPKHS